MRNRPFRENQAKKCQEFEELSEETNKARQLRVDELFMHQERNPKTVSQLLSQNSGFTEKKKNLCLMRENFTILTQRAADVPRSQSTFDDSESQNNALPRS